MAKNPETVRNFLEELAAKLQPLWDKERQIMLDMKKEQYAELGKEFDGKINYWDFRFLQSMVEEKQYAIDQEKLKEYFPMEVVTKGLLEIYQRILGLKFTKLEGIEVIISFSVYMSLSLSLSLYLSLHLYLSRYGTMMWKYTKLKTTAVARSLDISTSIFTPETANTDTPA